MSLGVKVTRSKPNGEDEDIGGVSPSRIVWPISIATREDGTLEVHVKKGGHYMAKAAMDALRSIDRIRQEPGLSLTHG